jgi:hypothetical protein
VSSQDHLASQMRLLQVSTHEGVLTDSQPYSHSGYSVIVRINVIMERKDTFDDAVAAAEALREISAGHEEAAAAILRAAGLEALSNQELEGLCERFGVEV